MASYRRSGAKHYGKGGTRRKATPPERTGHPLGVFRVVQYYTQASRRTPRKPEGDSFRDKGQEGRGQGQAVIRITGFGSCQTWPFVFRSNGSG
jgi:hypothetical protein